MSTLFFLNNFHFSIEVFGSLVFFIIAWLAFDAYLVRKDSLTLSRSLGFLILMVWELAHALDVSSDIFLYTGHIAAYVGLLLIISGLIKESFIQKPKFEGLFVLPSFSKYFLLFHGLISLGFLSIFIISFRQYKRENKKSILFYCLGFIFLAVGGLIDLFYDHNSSIFAFAIGHLFELTGFLSLGWWAWSYLRSRIKEEILIILTSITLLMAVIISLSFSTILVGQIQETTKENLMTNAKVLDFAVLRLEKEAGAKTELIAEDQNINDGLEKNDFTGLEILISEHLKNSGLGFLMVLNSDGEVILRAHALTGRGDNLSAEKAVKRALSGKSLVSIEPSTGEGFSIRSASPIFSKDEVIGVIVGGFQLDNAFVDSIKKLTGLDMSIYDGTTRVATTIFNPDKKTRSVGIVETSQEVIDSVIIKKMPISTSSQVSSKYYLASYVPTIDNDRVVGMISSAKAQNEILDTINRTNRLTLVTVIVLMLILALPIYLISRRLGRELG